MTSRPYDLARRAPGVVAATFTARRLPTASERDAAGWRAVRLKKRRVHTSATLDQAAVAPRTSAALLRHWQLDAEARLTCRWLHADFCHALEPLGMPAVPSLEDGNGRRRVRRIATWETASYVGRLVIFNLTVAILHLAILWWMLLRIGG